MRKVLSLLVVLLFVFCILLSNVSAKNIWGDICTDGDVNASDAVKLAQYLAGWTITFTPDEQKAADVFYDGIIDTKDAVKLAQYLADWKVILGDGTESPTPPAEETTTPPLENTTDEIIDSLVHIEARPDFSFRYDLTNTTSGEASPIENDYYLSAYKVTNAQYAAFVSETSHKAPSYWKNGTYPEGKADHPVLNISYSDTVSYCEWLSTKYDDWTFRLPTEAEWENAAYGDYYGNTSVKYPNGTGTPSYNASTGELITTFNFNGVIAAKLFKEYGSNYIVNYIKGDFAGATDTLGECISISANGGVSNWANHGGSATKGYFLQTDLYAIVSADGGYTTPVGTYMPNSLGLYDMAGNCWDITSSVIVANNGLEKGVSCYAVRGGSWYATSRSCTLSYRGEGRKDSASSTVGFRIAADYTPSNDAE